MTRQEMKQFLLDNGINCAAVGRWERTGLYVADFFNKRMKEPVQPAKEYAAAIERVLPGFSLVDTHDTKADWRPGQPVIWASVTFRLDVE